MNSNQCPMPLSLLSFPPWKWMHLFESGCGLLSVISSIHLSIRQFLPCKSTPPWVGNFGFFH
jgi:hypothetical protein